MILTNQSFELYAAQGYKNPICTSFEEFQEDLGRIGYAKRLLNWYYTGKEINMRLLLNHFVILGNVFDKRVLCHLLFFRADTEKLESGIKTILLFLSFIIPDDYPRIATDIKIAKEIRRITHGT